MLARTVAAAEEERTRRGARQKHMVRGATCELVLVHCDEDTFAIERAANRTQQRLTLVQKCGQRRDDRAVDELHLDNVGEEGFGYASWILQRWDSLPECMFLLHGGWERRAHFFGMITELLPCVRPLPLGTASNRSLTVALPHLIVSKAPTRGTDAVMRFVRRAGVGPDVLPGYPGKRHIFFATNAWFVTRGALRAKPRRVWTALRNAALDPNRRFRFAHASRDAHNHTLHSTVGIAYENIFPLALGLRAAPSAEALWRDRAAQVVAAFRSDDPACQRVRALYDACPPDRRCTEACAWHWRKQCTATAAEERKGRGAASAPRMPARCLAGARVYVATAVYGADEEQWRRFRRVLRNVHALRSLAANVTLAIAVTDAPPAAVVSEPGWRLATTVRRKSRAERNLLMAHYREDVLDSLAAARHDYYLVVEADIDLRARQVDGLCAEHALLGASNTTYAPGLLRVEHGKGGVRSLVDLHIGAGCGARRVVVGGRPYATVRNPFAAYWFLPAGHLRWAVAQAEAARTGGTWLPRLLETEQPRDGGCSGCARYSGLWLGHWFTKLVPLRSAAFPSVESVLVHHMSDKYVFQKRVTCNVSDFEASVL